MPSEAVDEVSGRRVLTQGPDKRRNRKCGVPGLDLSGFPTYRDLEGVVCRVQELLPGSRPSARNTARHFLEARFSFLGRWAATRAVRHGESALFD
jgi:hypothetical protein